MAAGASAAGPRRRVAVVGAGGREHALAVTLARTADVVVLPGNPGMTAWPPLPPPRPLHWPDPGWWHNLDAGRRVAVRDARPEDVDADLYVIGPETPLVDGLADRLRAAGHLVVGPGADGARLEGSKAWMKSVLAEAGVPTAAHATFSEPGPAIEYLRSLPPPWVVKTDGLAAGKGVLVTTDREEAEADVAAKLSGATFGPAGHRVVIEEGMTGPELSLMALCDGTTAVALAPAQDFKRAGDGDRGPNTGGMGAYSPVAFAGPDLVEEVMASAVRPTLAALAERGVDYRGFLYAGLMITDDGPKVVEFNVRFGDPEAQVVLPRWEGDVAALLSAAAAGRLDQVEPPRFARRAAVCVVMAAEGYPGRPRTGDRIEGFEEAAATPDVAVFSAGVVAGPGGGLVTAGGRVLGVTGVGRHLALARERAYRAVDAIHWPGCQARRDIAASAASAADAAGGAGPSAASTSRPGRRAPH
ncbi:MAG TPA: phosphoribosylamine--glycine ligase [Acidimicrobiales bacterium]|nr:phosphoribosylamine--glycine ligase [Acidimicrobiales bacterium]